MVLEQGFDLEDFPYVLTFLFLGPKTRESGIEYLFRCVIRAFTFARKGSFFSMLSLSNFLP